MKTLLARLINRTDENAELTAEEAIGFYNFYSQQCSRIKAHKAYETDLSGSLGGNDSVLMKFDVGTYIAEIHQYFLEKRFYNHISEQRFHRLVVEILLPNETMSEMVEPSVRNQIFLGVLKNIAKQSSLELKQIVKFYYEFITLLQGDVNGRGKDEALTAYKSAIALLPKSETHRAEAATTEANTYTKLNVLSELTEALQIRSKRQLDRLFSPAMGLRFAVSFVVYAALILFVAVFLDYQLLGRIIPLGAVTINFDYLRIALVILIGLAIVKRIVDHVMLSYKRQVLKNVMNVAAARFSIQNSELEAFFKTKFLFDYRKVR